DLYNDVIQGRFEEGGGGFGDLVVQFVQGIADGQLRRNFGYGISSGLGGKGRRPGHPWIDLDGYYILVPIGAHGELYITAPGKVPDTAHHVDGHIAHTLKGAVG